MNYRKIIAALAAAWMCVYSLATPVFAAATGLDVEPEDGGNISTHVEGVVDGWESEDGYFDIIEDKTTTTDHRGRGVLISDLRAGAGEDVSVTFNGGTDVTTMGQEGGIGVHLFSMNKQVTARIEGEPIRIEDVSDNGRDASGIMVHTQAGGMIDFTSDADIEAVSRSEGKGLAAGKLNHIYGIYLRGEASYLLENYYIDDRGRRVPVYTNDKNQGNPEGIILNDPSGFYTGEQIDDIYGAAILKAERQEDEVISTYVFYICKSDGTLVAFSDPISIELYHQYNPNDIVTGTVEEGEEIEITVHSSEEDPGRVVTVKKDMNRGIKIAEDLYGNYFVYDGDKTIYSIMDENNTAYELYPFELGSPWIKADISGNISADGLMEADGLAALNIAGGMDIELQNGTSLSAEGSLAAGISLSGSKPYTVKGEDGGINIRAVGKTGERSDAIGLFSNHGSMGLNSEVSITGEGNSIYVETDLQNEATDPNLDTKRISAGILTNAMSAVRRGASDVRYEGSVEAVGKNVHGLYATAQQMGVNRTRVIGDITVKNTLNDGIYVDEYIPAGLSPMAAMFFDPKSDIYVRGNLTMEDAGSESSGIAAFGGTVIVDGNVEVNGAQGTSGGPMGIYAEGKDTIVLVTGELNSRVAVLIPSDDDVVNNANVYVWKYQDSSRGKTEQIGFVLKIDDQEELSDVTLESSSEHFVALERDGYTYYGARAGDTITIKGAPSEADIAVLDANEGEVEVTDEGDGTYTFTVPDKLGALVTLQKPAPTPTPTPTPSPKGFSDVQDPKNPYYKAIYWAADAGITKGYHDGTFGINRNCTRGECMMFLWRYAGKPAPKNVSKSPFKDVPKTHTFYKAILWGSQKGITKGYSDGTFGINRNVTRGECMMFLWRLRGKPAPKAVAKAPFPDVPKSHVFYNAVLWGYQKKVTTGFTEGKLKGKFGVNEKCSRGQIVTFLYRAKK